MICKRSEIPLLKLFIYDFLIFSPQIHSIPFDGDTLVRGNLQWPARSVGGHVVAFVVARFDTRTSGNRDLCWCDRTSGHHVLAWESTGLQQLPGRQKASSVKGQGKTDNNGLTFLLRDFFCGQWTLRHSNVWSKAVFDTIYHLRTEEFSITLIDLALRVPYLQKWEKHREKTIF